MVMKMTSFVAIALLALFVDQNYCFVFPGHANSSSLSEYLWEQTSVLRYKALNTPFIQAVAKGTADPVAFGWYELQDAAYVYHVKQSIDIAVGRAKEQDVKVFLESKSKSWEENYQSMCKDWGITGVSGVILHKASKAYMDHERTVAETMDPAYLVVAMIPCYKLWPWIGVQLSKVNKDHGIYTTWMSNNFDPTYQGFQKLDNLINSEEVKGTIDRTTALKVYSRSMQGEFEFFDSVISSK